MVFEPSRIVGPFVPPFLRARLGDRIDKMLAQADAIAAGQDESALAQRTALLTFAIRIVSALIAYGSQVLMARWLGAHEYGIFVWVWVAAVILGGLACIGFPSAVVRFIPQYRVTGDEAALRGVIFGSRFYSVLIASLVALAGMAGLFLFEDFVTRIWVLPLYLAAVCIPMLALGEVQAGVARSFNWVSIGLTPTYLVRPVLILMFMALALARGYEPSAATALGSTILATWFASIGQLLIMNRSLARAVPPGSRSLQPKTWILVSLPIFLVEGFFALLTNVDILIVGYYLPPSEVAIYFAAVKTLALVHFVYFAVKAGAAYRYSQYYTAGDMPRYESFVRETIKWTFWPSLLMGLLMLLAGGFLLRLFGPNYDSGYPLLFILLLGIIARASVGPAESVLTMSGQQNVCAAVFGVTLLVNVVLNLSLIPVYGLSGAATATTLALMFEAAALYSITLRRLGLRMFVFASTPSQPAEVG